MGGRMGVVVAYIISGPRREQRPHWACRNTSTWWFQHFPFQGFAALLFSKLGKANYKMPRSLRCTKAVSKLSCDAINLKKTCKKKPSQPSFLRHSSWMQKGLLKVHKSVFTLFEIAQTMKLHMCTIIFEMWHLELIFHAVTLKWYVKLFHSINRALTHFPFLNWQSIRSKESQPSWETGQESSASRRGSHIKVSCKQGRG